MEVLNDYEIFLRQTDAATHKVEPFYHNLIYNEKSPDEIIIKYNNYSKSEIISNVVTYHNLNNTYINENQPYTSTDNNEFSKLPLFHIYDGYLSAQYGSTITLTNELLHLINLHNKDINYDLQLFVHDYNTSYDFTFLKIFDFILADGNDIKYLFFGPPKHATALLFNKTDNFIQITYINTGEGVFDGLNIEEQTFIKNYIMYANIFKTLYLPRNVKIITAFMHYIKPFILFRYDKVSSEKKFNFLMNCVFYNFNICIDSEIMNVEKDNEYYPISQNGLIEVLKEPDFFNIFNTETKNINHHYHNFYNDIISVNKNKPYYTLLNNLFNNNTQERINKLFPEIIPHIKSHTNNLRDNYKQFNKEWNKITFLDIPGYKDYLKLAVSTFKNDLDKNNDIHFELQQSGTCVYKSCIGTIFLYHMLKHSTVSFVKIYKTLTLVLYTYLLQNIPNNQNVIHINTPNSFLIYNKLVNDGIVDDIYKPANLMAQHNIISITDYKKPQVNIVNVACVGIDKLNKFVDRIRNRDASIKNEIIEAYTMNKSYNNKQKEKELILLAILWEFYFNFSKWAPIFSDMTQLPDLDFYLFICMKVRINLTRDELLWINRVNYRYILDTPGQFYFNRMCNEFELWKHISDKYDTMIDEAKTDIKLMSNKVTPLLYTEFYDYSNLLNLSSIHHKKSNHKNYKFIYLFIVNNIIDKITPNIEGFDFIERYDKNIMSYPIDMTNMFSHILNIFTQNIDNYFENIAINVYIYIQTFLNFYQYFNLNDRYKIVSTIIKTLSKIEINEGIIKNDNIHPFVNSILNLINILSSKYYLSVFYNNDSSLYNTDYKNDTQLKYINVMFDYSNYDNFIKKIADLFSENKEADIEKFIQKIVNTFEFNIIDDNVNLNELTINYRYGVDMISSPYIDITTNTGFCPLISYLFINNNESPIYVTDKHLIIILNKARYKDAKLKKNIVMIFNITKDGNNITVNYNNIMINNKSYDYTNDFKTFPFLINAPQNCLNFVGNHSNKFSWISICHYKKGFTYLKNAVVDVEDAYYYAEFIIKTNMLTPYYDDINMKYINNVRKYKYGEWLFPGVKPGITINIEPITYNQITFDNIVELFEKGKDAVINVVTNILNSTLASGKKLSFIEWLNKENPFITGNSFDCSANCLYKPKDINKINEGLILLRNKIINEIRYTGDNIISFIANNYKILSLLLQVNNIITSMLRLETILNKCSTFSCHDIYEITEIFDMRENKMDMYEMIIEIIFGRVLRQEQLNRYRDMLNNYKTNQRTINQFMMGKGKSSIITPLLYYNLTNMKEKVYIIVPHHLKKQTLATYNDFALYLNNVPTVYSDDEIKLQFLKQEYDINGVYLIDEFDSMYNPLQSNFNIIINTKDTMDSSKIGKIFTKVYLYLRSKSIFPYEKYSLEEDVYNILLNDKFIKNVNFGMSKLNKSLRACIPYVRQDSPSEGSSFSSPIITLVLTIKYFYDNQNFTIYNEDLDKIMTYNKELFNKILQVNNIIIPGMHTMKTIEIFKSIKNIYTKYTIPSDIFKEYLTYIVSDITISDKIMNCSFIDIMQMPCKWMVGYSGTTNMILDVPPIKDNHLQYFNTTIIKDPDEETNVFTALMRHSEIIKFSNMDNLFTDLTNDIDVVIDACAIFKDFDNQDVAKELYKRTSRPVIYLTKDDDMMIYNDGPQVYSYSNVNNAMYYFSQRHIVGIDIMNQPTTLRGIVIINDDNTYTQIAQAIYRMRKLNKGQTIKICYTGNNKYDKSIDIYNKLLKVKEEEVKENNKPLLYLQYLKYYYRSTQSIKDKVNRNKYYEETELDALYDIIGKDIDESTLKDVILKRLYKNVFNSNKFPETDLAQILSCYKFIIDQPQTKLLELLFNVNSYSINTNINVIIEQNKETTMNTSIDVQRNISLSVDTQTIDVRFTKIKNTFLIYNSFYPNYSDSDIRVIETYTNFIYKYQPIINKKYKIFIPLNNIYFSRILAEKERYLMTQLVKFFIVMINETTFIIEPSTMISKYINVLPIYSLTGYIINKNNFPQNANTIDINNILNFRIYSNSGPIINRPCNDFALLFNIKESQIEDIDVDETSFIMYSLVYMGILFGLTNITTVKPHINKIINDSFGIMSRGSLYTQIIERIKGIYSYYIQEYYKKENTNILKLGSLYIYEYDSMMNKYLINTI